MCSPYTFDCYPLHYPLLISSAMSRFNDEVHLGKDAHDVLVKYGNDHKAAFETALGDANQDDLDRLSADLHERLAVALEKSDQTDAEGQAYHPARISGDALTDALKAAPLVP